MADRRVEVEVLVSMTWVLSEGDGWRDMDNDDVKKEIRKDVDDAMKGFKDDYFEGVDWEHTIRKDHAKEIPKQGEWFFEYAKEGES